MEFKKSYFLQVFFILNISHQIRFAETHSSGAPESRCMTMIPGHFAPKPDDPSPFKISVDKVNATGGQTLKIVLSAPSPDNLFKGFLVMVRKPGADDMSYGKFLDQRGPDANARGVTCFGNRNSAMTHRDNNEKQSVELVWIAPKNAEDEEYEIVVTFVKTFWTVYDNNKHNEKIRVAKTLPDDSEVTVTNTNTVRLDRPLIPKQPELTPTNESTSWFMNFWGNIVNYFQSS